MTGMRIVLGTKNRGWLYRRKNTRSAKSLEPRNAKVNCMDEKKILKDFLKDVIDDMIV